MVHFYHFMVYGTKPEWYNWFFHERIYKVQIDTDLGCIGAVEESIVEEEGRSVCDQRITFHLSEPHTTAPSFFLPQAAELQDRSDQLYAPGLH